MRPFALAPGQGESVQNPVGGTLTFKAMSSQTDGELTALDTVAAAGEGPPLHVHRGEDELIYIVQCGTSTSSGASASAGCDVTRAANCVRVRTPSLR